MTNILEGTALFIRQEQNCQDWGASSFISEKIDSELLKYRLIISLRVLNNKTKGKQSRTRMKAPKLLSSEMKKV